MTTQKKFVLSGILVSCLFLIGGLIWETGSFPTFFQEQDQDGAHNVSPEDIEDPELRRGMTSMRKGPDEFLAEVKRMGWDTDPSEVRSFTLKAPTDGKWSDPYNITKMAKGLWGDNVPYTWFHSPIPSELVITNRGKEVRSEPGKVLEYGPNPILKIRNISGSSEDIYWEIVILRGDKK